MERLSHVRAHLEAGRNDEALLALKGHLNDNPEDTEAIYVMGSTLFDTGDHGLAFQMFHRVVQNAPEKAAGWTGLGRCLDEWQDRAGALSAYQAALEREPDYYWALCCAAASFQRMGMLDKAIPLFQKAIEVNPDERVAFTNLGLAYLSLGRWAEAWPMVDLQIGEQERVERFYGKAEYWDVPPPGADAEEFTSFSAPSVPERLVVYGEQGIGDEVFYAACLPDLKDSGSRVAIETTQRLHGLFQRSFPWAEVHPTRAKPSDEWVRRFRPSHKVAISSLPGHFRPSPESCPGTPYLKACPERRRSVRALLDALPGLKIGVAWTGGPFKNGRFERQVDAEWLLEGLGVSPFKDPADVSLISLQYKLPPVVPGVHHWPWLTQSQDYDDTAALVAELDAVVSVPTSIVNLAGALGTPTWVLLPDDYHHWRYGVGGRTHPWYRSLTICREPWDLGSILEEIKNGAQ